MVGLFFAVNGRLLLHSCELCDAEDDGLFLGYPPSHMEIWNRLYYNAYKVDFDYYPRGRIIYRKSDDTFLLYRDRCITNGQLKEITDALGERNVEMGFDEHYVCQKCNEEYCF